MEDSSKELFEKQLKFINLLLKYRKVSKLLSTFLAPFESFVQRDGRIRPSFHNTVCVTGRLSCSKPNIEQLPNQNDIANIRNLFIAEPGNVLIVADYSGQEVRIMAQESGDTTFKSALIKGLDLHQVTADAMGVSRKEAKCIVFGVAYGKSSYGFSKDFNCSEKEAQVFIDCLAPNHKILTADLTWRSVESLQQGDKLLSFEPNSIKGKRRKWKESEVILNNSLLREMYRLHFSDGTSIDATENHPFLIRNGTQCQVWRTVKQLIKGLKICEGQYHKGLQFSRAFVLWETIENYKAGWLAGFFDGEGCIVQHKQVGKKYDLIGINLVAAQNQNAALDTAKQYLTDLDIPFSITNNKDCYIIRITDGVRGALRFLGSVRPKRLLENFNINKLGAVKFLSENIRIVNIEPLGLQEACGLQTSSGTYISDGFLSHNSFFKQYPGLKRAIEQTRQQVYKHGFVKNMSGRKRRFPDFHKLNKWGKERCYRMAFNFKIQGYAADVTKRAAANVIQNNKLHLINIVHDELVIETSKDYVEEGMEYVRRAMIKTLPIFLPWDIDISYGERYGEAK